MHQVVKGASPGIQIRYAVIKFKIEEDPSGIHPAAQLPVIMHIKKDCVGVEYPHDSSA